MGFGIDPGDSFIGVYLFPNSSSCMYYVQLFVFQKLIKRT